MASLAPDWKSAGLLYHSLNFFYRKKFGDKVWKISVDAGCTCPNRDGHLGNVGCLFCSPESFSPSRRLGQADIAHQIEAAVQSLRRGAGHRKFIAYFQPGTNTYGPIRALEKAYREALSHPDIVGFIVGTRPDCVGDDVLDLLGEFAKERWLMIEYGLQTIHDRTLRWLNRGHDYAAFLDAYERTRQRGLNLGVHVILGLPGESRDDMLATARALAQLEIHSVKPHNLYAVRDTPLADEVVSGRVRLAEFHEYVGCLVDFLEEIPANIVVDRLCGDAPLRYLIGPSWCLKKAAVREAVEAEFRRRGTYQGAKAQ